MCVEGLGCAWKVEQGRPSRCQHLAQAWSVLVGCQSTEDSDLNRQSGPRQAVGAVCRPPSGAGGGAPLELERLGASGGTCEGCEGCERLHTPMERRENICPFRPRMGLQRVTRVTRVTPSVHIAAAGRSVGAKKQPVLQSAASSNWDGCLFAGPQVSLVTTTAASHSEPRTRLLRRARRRDTGRSGSICTRGKAWKGAQGCGRRMGGPIAKKAGTAAATHWEAIETPRGGARPVAGPCRSAT
jgi:hypothetical protein